MRDILKNLLPWFLGAVALITVFNYFEPKAPKPETIPYSEFLHRIKSDEVIAVTIENNQMIEGQLKNDSAFKSYMPIPDNALVQELLAKNIEVKGLPLKQRNFWLSILLNWLPNLLFIGVLIFSIKQMGSSGKGLLSFGRSRARLSGERNTKVTFQEVAGAEEAKAEVKEIVEFLRDPPKFQKLGAKIPRGVLLMGPPGTGKTLLARAVAGEAKVPFFNISGSEFLEMFVGVGASRVRDMFEQAKKQAPCIIFIDEIDAVGRQRGAGLGAGHNEEREQTLNQLLVEMDGFEENNKIMIIGATNRPDVLDPALLRPGRFDRQIVMGLPDIRGRDQILAVHLKKVRASQDVKPLLIARGTPGFSGADLANLVNEAALLAASSNQSEISMTELEKAKDKVMLGPERRSLVMNDKEKKLTAYHEAGHAIIGRLVPEHDPIYKVTIMPRGHALGLTMFLPEEDRYSYTKQRLESQIASLFGGRLAEIIIFGPGQVTTGASNDIERATEIARNMVIKWGLSTDLGPLNYHQDANQGYGRQPYKNGEVPLSDSTTHLIDQAIRKIIDRNYQRAEKLLKENISKLHVMADALIKYETIESEQIDEIMADKVPTPPKGWKEILEAEEKLPSEPELATLKTESASTKPKPKSRAKQSTAAKEKKA